MVLENGFTLGFLGCGVMGGAILTAILNGVENKKDSSSELNDDEKPILPGSFIVSAKTEAERKTLREKFGDKIKVADDNQTVVDNSHVVVLGFKPDMVGDILGRLHFSHFTVLVSILAGTTIETIHQYTSNNTYIVRAMPNTAASIGQGMTALSYQGEYQSSSPISRAVEWMFSQTGEYTVVDESKQNVCVALCGSGPAFCYVFMEALTDAANKMGLPYDVGRKMAAQVLKGSAQMVLDGNHPAVLRNAVCTPAGTTINGLAELEHGGLRSTVIRGIEASTKLAKELSQPPVETSSYPPASGLHSPSQNNSRTASHVNISELAHQLSLSRRNTIDRR